LEPLGQLFLREHAIGRRVAGALEVAVRGDVLIERHLVGAMAAPPEPMTVASLIHRDTIDPGAQAGLAAETVNRAEDAQEHFLWEVGRLGAVAQQVHRQLPAHALVLGDQVGARGLLAGRTLLHERSFAPADVGPTSDPRLLHRDFHYTKVRHPKSSKVPMGW